MWAALDGDERRLLRTRPHPAWVAPMLATLTDRRFSDPGWIYERKLDGIRGLAFRKGRDVRLLSRNRKDLAGAYPELVEALRRQPRSDFIVDGEVVALERGATRFSSFSRLQGRMQLHEPGAARATGIAVRLYVFDLLRADGLDTTALPQIARKSLLRRALVFTRPIHYVPHVREVGERLYRRACASGWEGVIAKRGAAAYASARSRDWLKFKCSLRQELVIVGYTDPRGGRIGFGALLVGYHERGRLRFAGKVGTGFGGAMLAELSARLRKLVRPDPPVEGKGLPRLRAHWVEPRLVGEVEFTEWTPDGKLRHPSFVGLRADKDPREVVREHPTG